MKSWVVILMLTAGLITGVTGCSTSESTNPAKDLFAQYGWRIVGEPVENRETSLPDEFTLAPGFPWRLYLDLSTDVGLDFSPLAGTKVTELRFRVQDSEGDRLKEVGARGILWGVALLDSEKQVVGAWFTDTDNQGNFVPGMPGHSLQGKNIEEVTELNWLEYSRKYADKK